MLFVELLKAIFYGIVEGITEWLPISSTGHLILVEEFVKLNQSAAFMEMFNNSTNNMLSPCLFAIIHCNKFS